MTDITRREMLGLALASPLLARPQNRESKSLDRQSLVASEGRVVLTGGLPAGKEVQLLRSWNGPLCRSRIVNRSRQSVRVKEVVLFDLKLTLPPATRLYGEGFQMLSQTGGTLAEPVDYSSLTDAKHYKMPIPTGARAF